MAAASTSMFKIGSGQGSAPVDFYLVVKDAGGSRPATVTVAGGQAVTYWADGQVPTPGGVLQPGETRVFTNNAHLAATDALVLVSQIPAGG